MKCRQDQPALPMMCFTFAGEQSIAEDALRLLQRASLDEIRILGHEHIADVVRMLRKEHLPVQNLESGEVSVAGCQVLQESKGILAKSKERNIDWAARPRRAK